jgi:hypothetical protein
MSIKIKRKLYKAQGGGEPCQPGYIKVDGVCVDNATRDYVVYETGNENEFSTTFNPKYPGAWEPSPVANYKNLPSYKEHPKYSTLPPVTVVSEGKNKNTFFDDEGFYIDPDRSSGGLDWIGGDPTVRLNRYINMRKSQDEDITKYLQLYFDFQTGSESSSAGRAMVKRYLDGNLPKNVVDNLVSEARETEDQIKFHDNYDPNKSISSQGNLIDSYNSDMEARRKMYYGYQTNQDYGKALGLGSGSGSILGDMVNLGFNTLRGITLSPASNAALILKGINPNAYTREKQGELNAFKDVSGISNYPYLQESLNNVGTQASTFYNNPSWENFGNVVLGGTGAFFNAIGSLPLIGSVEGAGGKLLAREAVPASSRYLAGTKGLVSTLTSPKTYGLASRESRGLTPWRQLTTREKAMAIGVTPIVAGKKIGSFAMSSLGPMADVTMAPWRAAVDVSNKAKIPLTMGPELRWVGHVAPFIRGDKFYENLTGTTPAEQYFGAIFPSDEEYEQTMNPDKPTVKNYPVNPEAGVYQPNIPNVYLQPKITRDTTINFVSPSGKVYSTNTGSKDYKEVFNKIISRNPQNWDEETKSFKIDPAFFKDHFGDIDVDAAMQEILPPKKQYGGPMSEIPNLFGYQPDSPLPKAQGGGECPDGQQYDPNTGKCVTKDFTTLTTVPALSPVGMTGGFNWSDPTGLGGMGLPAEGPSASSFLPTYDIVDPEGNVTPSNKNNFYLDPNNTKLYQPDPKQSANANIFDLPGKKKRKGFKDFSDKLVDFGETLRAGANAISFIQDQYITNPREQKDWNKKFRERKFTAGLKPLGTGSRGYYDINTGILLGKDTGFKVQNMAQFGGMMLNNSNMGTKKIRIKVVKDETEEMAYGGQLGYGFDLGQKGTYSPMPKTKSEEVGKTIPEVPREEANIEAEKGETVYADVDGDGMYEHMNIEGKRHTQGGTPLNVPEGSFIFSDTAKMRIKDPEVLKNFGLSASKKGYTPAEIAKKYDINKYKAIVEDPTSDYTQKNTAQMMIKNYQRKLAELALVQEEMKGFPQGIPQMALEILPEALIAQVQESIDAQQNQAPISPEVEENMPEEINMEEQQMNEEENMEQEPTEEELIAMYGGDEFEYGGMLDPFDGGGSTPPDPPNKWQQKIDKIKALKKQTVWSERYGRGDTDIAALQPATGTGVYGEIVPADVEDFKKRHKWFFDANPDWDETNEADVKRFQRAYNTRARAKGMDFDFFDPNSNEMDKLDGLFGEYTYNAPDLSDDPVQPAPVTGWTCTGRDANNQPQLVGPTDYPDETARTAAGAYASAQEAMTKGCPPKDIIPPPGTPPKRRPPTPVPFKYMTPDMWKAAGIAGTRINKYLPFIPDTPFESRQFIPEDWRGKASQLQSLTRQVGEQMGTFVGGPQSQANLSNLFAQQAPQLMNVISDVDARNIAGVNQFNAIEQERRDRAALLRSANQVERWKGNVVANQQYDNSLNARNMALTDQMANAWNNRMNLGLTNATNKYYFTDPVSGRTFFKSGYGPEDLGGGSGASDWSALGNDYLTAQQAIPGLTREEWIRMRTGKAKYGGGMGRKNITPLSAVGRMLENGYGFPF